MQQPIEQTEQTQQQTELLCKPKHPFLFVFILFFGAVRGGFFWFSITQPGHFQQMSKFGSRSCKKIKKWRLTRHKCKIVVKYHFWWGYLSLTYHFRTHPAGAILPACALEFIFFVTRDI